MGERRIPRRRARKNEGSTIPASFTHKAFEAIICCGNLPIVLPVATQIPGAGYFHRTMRETINVHGA